MLNGASSSGKSSIARCLQATLPEPWLSFSVDTLVEALPGGTAGTPGVLEFAPDGGVSVGPAFAPLEAAWITGLAAMARAGARLVIDEVLLNGAAGQRRWEERLAGLAVRWVGVRCDPEVAAAREAARGDRVTGMAASQSALVHQGLRYDLEVDTTHTTALDCARTIAAELG